MRFDAENISLVPFKGSSTSEKSRESERCQHFQLIQACGSEKSTIHLKKGTKSWLSEKENDSSGWCWPTDARQWDNVHSNPQSQAEWRASGRQNEFKLLFFINREFLTNISICSSSVLSLLAPLYLSNAMAILWHAVKQFFASEICSQCLYDATNDLPFTYSTKRPGGNCCH